jgi:uncharacterized protein YndB with AHSA1/START domain
VIRFTIGIEIARPPGEVFAYIIDPAKLATWQTNTISAVPEGDAPIGIGTRLREVHRGPGGREVESLVEVSEFEPDRTFALRMLEGPLPIHAKIALEPSGNGTRMQFTVHGRPGGPVRLAQPLLRLVLRRQFKAHCSHLKRLLEGAHAPAQPPA